MDNKSILIEIDSIDIDNVTESEIKNVEKQIISRNKKLQVWEDYYDGGGKQWSSKGQITRSGYQIVDKLTYESSESLSTSQNIQDVKRKLRWAEANVIDFAIDEAARAVRGEGKYSFEIKDASEELNEEFNAFWNNSNGDFNISKIVKKAKVFGHIPLFVMENKFKLENPYNFVFLGNEDDESTFIAIESKRQKGWQINNFFLNNFGASLEIEKGKVVLYTAVYTFERIVWFIDGVEVASLDHNLGYCPVRRIENPEGSEIVKDIPYQDQINIILSETSEVFKAHLNPAVVIKDDGLASAASAASAKGEPLKIERGPATVMITNKDGSVDYIQWDGLPRGTIETLRVYERHFYNKKGISLFSEDEGGQPESGVAKRESRATLRSIARDFRDSMNITLQQICNIWLAYRGFLPEELIIIEAPIDKMTAKEVQELEAKHWTIHQDDTLYLIRTGQFSENEVDEVRKLATEAIITT